MTVLGTSTALTDCTATQASLMQVQVLTAGVPLLERNRCFRKDITPLVFEHHSIRQGRYGWEALWILTTARGNVSRIFLHFVGLFICEEHIVDGPQTPKGGILPSVTQIVEKDCTNNGHYVSHEHHSNLRPGMIPTGKQ
jgi:hypothetical protein